MINIKGAAGLAKRAINRIVIARTNCYRTVGGQGLLLSYTDVHPLGDGEAFPTVGTKCLATNLLHSLVWRPNARPPHLAPTS